MQALRWFAIIPAALGYVFGVVIAFGIVMIGEWSCPAEEVVSGYCVAGWISYVTSVSLVAGASVTAFCMVLLSSVVAPRYKDTVASIMLMLGSAYAVFSATDPLRELFSAGISDQWINKSYVASMLSAVCAGFFGRYTVVRFWYSFRRQHP
jgi:hypothetical protein